LGVGSFWLPLIPFILETIKDKFKLFKKHRQEILKESKGKKTNQNRTNSPIWVFNPLYDPLGLAS